MNTATPCKFFAAVLILQFPTIMSVPSGAAPKDERDSRLDRPISVSHGRVYLGELLEEVSASSKVRLRVDDHKGAVSGIDLTVFLHDRPLREVMDGLRVLFSSRFDRWEWEKSGTPGGGYLLLHQRAPTESSGQARKEMADHFDADVRAFYDVAKLPDDQRKLRAAGLPQLFPGGRIPRPGNLDLIAKLTPGELDAVLQGRPVAPADGELGERARGALGFGLQGESPGDSKATLMITWRPPALGPTLWARNSHGVAGNLVGGPTWDRAWSQKEGEGWQDRWTEEADLAYRERVSGDPKAGEPLREDTIAGWLKVASVRQGLNVIADPVAPRHGYRTSAAWLAPTSAKTVLALQFHEQLTTKKLGETYLLRHATSTLSPRLHLVAWPVIQGLRREANRNGGFLGPDGLLVAAEMSRFQSDALREEFPSANAEVLAPWRPILRFYAKLPPEARELLTGPAGLRLAAAGLIAREALLEGPDPQGIRGLDLSVEEARRAVVALRTEHVKIASGGRLGRNEQDGLRYVWEVQVEGRPAHRATIDQLPRVALQPE